MGTRLYSNSIIHEGKSPVQKLFPTTNNWSNIYFRTNSTPYDQQPLSSRYIFKTLSRHKGCRGRLYPTLRTCLYAEEAFKLFSPSVLGLRRKTRIIICNTLKDCLDTAPPSVKKQTKFWIIHIQTKLLASTKLNRYLEDIIEYLRDGLNDIMTNKYVTI